MNKLLNTRLSLILLIVTLIYVNPSQSQISNTNIVEIEQGTLKGISFSTHREFLGIPFAQPPLGSLRWNSPVAAANFNTSVYDATYGRDGCPQVCNLPAGVCPSTYSEDCLYLNVFTPIIPQELTEPLPVMVFIPGGRFEMGAANTPLYNGSVFCNSSNVILVTINYRLGVLGFLANDGFKGNYGFEDQILALQWVQNNIKAFGGDNSQVTIFGESAGGSSVALHLTCPSSAGLFSKAIIESNPFALPMKTDAQFKTLAGKFAKALGCDVNDLNCYYAKTADEIVIAQNSSENYFDVFAPILTFLPWTPIVDGQLITDQPLALMEKGQFHKVPVILGTVHNEALIFVASIAENISKLEFIGGLIDIFGISNELKIYKLYENQMNSTNYLNTLSAIGTDYIFVCPTRNAASHLSNSGVDVFLYQFQHITSFNVYAGQFAQCADAVCHGLELPYVFDTASQDGYTFTAAEQQLSLQLMNYWTNFAKSGNPNQGLPVPTQWSTYNSNTDEMLIFQTPPFIQSGYLSTYCNYWDSIGYQNGW
ncbi:hypothetical protein CYY_010279 [Polysphondylium violaceum]|uniref:Carboxylic ester hydrolase n=1 Tax=Polysphondylium violaceum TaxID=133409 RepID=A0A8J4PJA8_9MYCE|nr:hypothetical protein CYY_010279 [Polysphondylium violaceum]